MRAHLALAPGQVQHGGQGGQEAGQHQAEAVPRRGRGRAVGGLVIDQAGVCMGGVIYTSIHIVTTNDHFNSTAEI